MPAVKTGGYTHAEGFPPVFDEHSRVLILGSFPSVQSRRVSFYYGNPQNRFWKMLSDYFQAPMPATTEEKRAFVLERGVALWDAVMSCDVAGSKDESIVNYVPRGSKRYWSMRRSNASCSTAGVRFRCSRRDIRIAACPIF